MIVKFRDPLLAALSGLLLATPFNDSSLFLLSWIGFIPLLFALRDKSPVQGYLLGMVCGLALYGSGTRWVTHFVEQLWSPGLPVTLLIATLFWLYSAQLPALLVLAFLWLRQRSKVSDLLLFPLLTTLFFAHFPMLFQAQLGESQSAFLVALQAVSLTGVYGLDMLIALVNMLLFRWLFATPSPWRDRIGLAVSALPLLWMGYGYLTLNHWDKQMTSWPQQRLGLVQKNLPPGESGHPQPGHTLAHPRALALSQQLAHSGARLVVWPEAGFDGYFARPSVATALHRAAADMEAAILLQGMETTGSRQFNSAALIGANGEETGRYQKIQRVAFGEYLPLLEAFPRTGSWVREQLGGFFNRVAAGKTPARFAVDGMTVVPLICYEALFPALVANAARGGDGAELLVVMSNNVWFGASRLPHQHLNASVLRAVENRRPLMHVINNGPSAVILPNGRQVLQTRYDEEAAYSVDVPLSQSSGETFFTRYGQGVLSALYLLLGVIVLRAMPGFRMRRPALT